MTGAAKRCLLLVEDDTLVRDTVALMLEEDGYEVIAAEDAQGALDLIREGLDTPVIVTDVDLGAGPSGAELADALHRLRPELRIIFITGRAQSLAGRGKDPREAILRKPFEVAALSQLVRRMAGPRPQ